jgi:cbb3-type cytochrome oxidase subunit 3
VVFATNVAFDVVFAVFVVAMVILAVVVITWAVRRDRRGRRDWLAARGTDQVAGTSNQRQPRPPAAG